MALWDKIIRRKSKKSVGTANLLDVFPLGFVGNDQDITFSKAGAAAAFTSVYEVNACIQSITSGIDLLDWNIVHYADGIRRGEKGDIIANRNDLQPRHVLPEAFWNFQFENKMSFLHTASTDYLLYGEFYIERVENGFGQNKSLEWLNPLGVQVDYHSGQIDYFRYGWNMEYINIPSERVAYLHNRNPSNDFVGLPIALTVLDEINIARNLDRFLRDHFANNARPGMILTPVDVEHRMSNTDYTNLLNKVREQLKGVGGQYSTMVMQEPLTATTFEQPDIAKNTALNEAQSQAIFDAFGVPQAMRGNTNTSPYKTDDGLIQRFYLDTVLPLAHLLQRYINGQIMPFFDDGGLTIFEFDTSPFDTVTEADMLEAQVTDIQVQGTLIDLFTAAEKQEIDPDDNLKGLYMVQGIPVPASELPSYWEKQLLVSPSVYGAEEITGKPLPQPVPPEEVIPTEEGGVPVVEGEARDVAIEAEAAAEQEEQEADEVVEQKGIATDAAQSYCVMGRFEDTSSIQLAQDSLRAMFDDAIELVDPETFHVTLLYTEDTSFGNVQDSLPLNPAAFSVMVDGFGTFDTPSDNTVEGNFAIYLNIRPEGAIVPIQAALAQTALEGGVEISDHSISDDYHPHITLAYAPFPPVDDMDIKPFPLLVNVIEVTGDDYQPLIVQGLKVSDEHKAELLPHFKLYEGDELFPPEGMIKVRLDRELHAWKRFESDRMFGKKKRTREFHTDVIPPWIRFEIIDRLDRCKRKSDVIRAFDTVMDAPHIKTVTSYQRNLRDLSRGAWNGSLSIGQFSTRLDETIDREFRSAFVEGVQRGGLAVADLTDEERDELDALIESEKSFVDQLSFFIFDNRKGEGKLNAVRSRVDLWVARYFQVNETGFLIASGTKKLMWKWNPRKEHCLDCANLNGRVYTANTWRNKIMITPRSFDLICKGFRCGCGYEETNKPITRGRHPRIRGRQ